jgi:hypothetical protein
MASPRPPKAADTTASAGYLTAPEAVIEATHIPYEGAVMSFRTDVLFIQGFSIILKETG